MLAPLIPTECEILATAKRFFPLSLDKQASFVEAVYLSINKLKDINNGK